MPPTPQHPRGSPSSAPRLLDRALGRFRSRAPTGFRPPARQLPDFRPPARELPDWFVGNRVHGQTRLIFGLNWHETDEFKQAALGFKRLGARVFTRHVKSADEDPPWPTAKPKRLDGTPLSDAPREINGVTVEPGRDVALEIIDEAHAQGLRIVAYYWHMTEASVAVPHPDVEPHPRWVCRHAPPNDDEPIVHDPRGIQLDITGPYREVVLTRLLELAEKGADGFNFDERHLPPDGCWRSALEAAWRAETGDRAPRDETDPDYPRFLDFKARRIEDTFQYWRDEVKARHPGVVFAVSTTSIPALTTREMTTRLVRIADSAKNEYRLALNPGLSPDVFEGKGAVDAPLDHVRQALGWTVLRDGADGRPPRIWAPGLRNVDHANAFAASLITFGCIAHMDVDERAILRREPPERGKTPLKGIRDAFELGRRVSPHLADTAPVRWAAVHFSERIRNLRGLDYRQAWREVLWPLVGAFEVLSQDGLPVGVVNDHQLGRGELAGYRLLFLTNPSDLTALERQRIAEFRASGGAVVENRPGWAWSDPALRRFAAAGFRKAVAPHLGSAPVGVKGGPRSRYAVAYRAPDKLVVAVTNDFGWVQVTRPPKFGQELPPANPRAPDVTDLQVAWRKGHGLPEPGPLPFQRLRVVEAVTGAKLPLEQSGNILRVRLPPFPFMALLVVTRAHGFGPFGAGRNGTDGRRPAQ